ncbi:MBL fold metallo-hydrolase [Polycladidibacter stylochi]|uniref:MBL fold metallo-hydrolase n=1 Tax=Polycladidibacter stylochi TaxID=1807766 RepID=UPI000AB18BE8|nr:MBL fold metallo-hydrolase [Pseudovibrio stylochi]
MSHEADRTQEMGDELPKLQITVLTVTAFQQNCSVLWSPATLKGVVVDPGGDVDMICQALDEMGVQIERILITHGHADHVGGATELAKKLAVPIEGPHLDDKFLLESVVEQAERFGLPGTENVVTDRWLSEGDVVLAAGLEFNVLHCPGHTPGHVVFYQSDMKVAISGDVLFQGSIGRTDLPGGNHGHLIASIKEKLLPLGDDVAFLPGHGEASTFGEERLHNPFLK